MPNETLRGLAPHEPWPVAYGSRAHTRPSQQPRIPDMDRVHRYSRFAIGHHLSGINPTLYDTVAEAFRADREDTKAELLTDIPAHMLPEQGPPFGSS